MDLSFHIKILSVKELQNVTYIADTNEQVWLKSVGEQTVKVVFG